MTERESNPEARKEQWLSELADFIVEAGKNGWAANATKEKDNITGKKKLVYERDDWKYVDEYTGYFVAPGTSDVFYKGRHVWTMTYGGKGQTPAFFDKAPETYAFLKTALMQPDPDLPIRGAHTLVSDVGNWEYAFMFDGDLTDAAWHEIVLKDDSLMFSQDGTCGIVVDKDAGYNPVYPWDL